VSLRNSPKLIEQGWASSVEGARTIRFRRNGEKAVVAWYSGAAIRDERQS
jgi:hypothetical protein